MPDSLAINWPYLLIAAALLWFPRQWLRTGKTVLRKRRKPDGALERLAGVGARDPEDRSVQPSREFANFRNYVDLFRALAGGYCLTQFAFPAAGEGAADTAFIVEALVLLVAVMIQTVRFDGRLSFYAAIFFFMGLNVGASAHYSSLFAFALVLAINPIIPNPRMFLTTYGLLMLPFGILLGTDLRLLAVGAGLVLLPPLLSLLTKRPVVIFSRKAKPASS
ncbi:MAG: hypothetical protein JWQ62_2485 [Lacunisphaera sp.]|nr:hypothetical protein [Lacunisphaera sp.]